MPRVLPAAASLNSYVSQLTTSFQGLANMDSPAVVAGSMAAATVLIVGACLLLAPVVFGADWLSYAVPIIGVLLGVVGSNFFLNTDGGYYDAGAAIIGLDGDAKCAVTIVLVILSAIVTSWLVTKLKPYFFFALFAGCAFFWSYVGSGLLLPLLPPLPGPVDMEVYAVCGLISAGLGPVAFFHGEKIIDFVLGVTGAALLAQGTVNLTGQALPSAIMSALKMDTYYVFYVAGLTVLLVVLRIMLVVAREAAGYKAAPVAPAGKTSAPPTKGGRPAGAPPKPPAAKMGVRAKQMH